MAIGMARIASDGTGGQVAEIPDRGSQFWEFPGCELVEDFTAADWLTPLVSHNGGEVRSWMPEVFDAYARVFYPIVRSGLRVGDQIVSRDPPTLRWSDVAIRNGWTVHPEMAAEAVLRPAPGSVMDPEDVNVHHVESTLEEGQFGALASILARYTHTPDVTWYALWAGYGDLMVGWAPTTGRRQVHQVAHPELLALPDREYLLYRAPMPAWKIFREADHPEVPDLWWPDDRSWCVVTDTDFHWLYVGGTRECIADIVASTEIEALPTSPDHRSFWIGSDLINDPHGETLPEQMR
jgi:GNAT superfamily N-acetyltransferase